MESIPLEQLALTCQTLRDNRILELHQENAKLKPKCHIENGTLYVESVMYRSSFVICADFNHNKKNFQDLLAAMQNGKSSLYYH